jgi:hypothetical protein
VGVSVERGDELGHPPIALDPAEAPLGVEHPGAGQRSTICTSRHRVTLRSVVPAMEIIDWTGV